MKTYRIIRKFLQHSDRVVRRGLTLKEAKDHCSDPETSYKTCTTEESKKRTKTKGPWFDRYEKE